MARVSRGGVIRSSVVQNEMVARLVWAGLLASLGALASIAVQRLAVQIWIRAFGEDPPE